MKSKLEIEIREALAYFGYEQLTSSDENIIVQLRDDVWRAVYRSTAYEEVWGEAHWMVGDVIEDYCPELISTIEERYFNWKFDVVVKKLAEEGVITPSVALQTINILESV